MERESDSTETPYKMSESPTGHSNTESCLTRLVKDLCRHTRKKGKDRVKGCVMTTKDPSKGVLTLMSVGPEVKTKVLLGGTVEESRYRVRLLSRLLSNGVKIYFNKTNFGLSVYRGG